jgi:hypothetical protein
MAAKAEAGPSDMEIDGEEGNADGSISAALAEAVAELSLLDFSVLSEDMRRAQDGVAKEAVERQFLKEIAETAAELER